MRRRRARSKPPEPLHETRTGADPAWRPGKPGVALRRVRAALAASFPELFLRWLAPSSLELGLIGETLAARHLARLGFRLIARRLATPHGELDLVLRRGTLLLAAEVKSSRASPSPPGAQAIRELRWRPGVHLTRRQLARQGRALRWLRRHAPWAEEARIDLVEVLVGPPHRLSHAAGLPWRSMAPLRWRDSDADEGLGG